MNLLKKIIDSFRKPKGNSYEYLSRFYDSTRNPINKKFEIGDHILIHPTPTSCGQKIYPCQIKELKLKHVYPYTGLSWQLCIVGTGTNEGFKRVMGDWYLKRIEFIKNNGRK